MSCVLEENGFHSVKFGEILALLNRYQALDAARERAQEYAEKAKQYLESFPDSAYKDALRSLPDFIIDRES